MAYITLCEKRDCGQIFETVPARLAVADGRLNAFVIAQDATHPTPAA